MLLLICASITDTSSFCSLSLVVESDDEEEGGGGGDDGDDDGDGAVPERSCSFLSFSALSFSFRAERVRALDTTAEAQRDAVVVHGEWLK